MTFFPFPFPDATAIRPKSPFFAFEVPRADRDRCVEFNELGDPSYWYTTTHSLVEFPRYDSRCRCWFLYHSLIHSLTPYIDLPLRVSTNYTSLRTPFPFLSFPFLSFPFLSFPFLSFPSFLPVLSYLRLRLPRIQLH